MIQTVDPFKFEDLYGKQTEADKNFLLEKFKIAQTIGDNARACINTGVFQDYKKNFELAYEKILDAMISYTNNFNGNPEMYAMRMMCFIQQIQDLRLLLVRTEIDAKKGIIPENERVEEHG